MLGQPVMGLGLLGESISWLLVAVSPSCNSLALCFFILGTTVCTVTTSKLYIYVDLVVVHILHIDSTFQLW